jgi:hypothetical protein
MDSRDQFVIQVLHEKAHAQQLAAAWCGLACGLQTLLEQAGAPSGLPPLGPELPLGTLATLGRQLDARLAPPAAANGAHPDAGDPAPVVS